MPVSERVVLRLGLPDAVVTWFVTGPAADALVRAPAAFRKHGVYLSARDLEAA
jgi:hypothetical protein